MKTKKLMPYLRPTTIAAIFSDVCGTNVFPEDDRLQQVANECWTVGIALVGEKEFDNLVGEA